MGAYLVGGMRGAAVKPWMYVYGRTLRHVIERCWPDLLCGLIGVVLALLVACGRGPGPCAPRAQSDGSQPTRSCEVRR